MLELLMSRLWLRLESRNATVSCSFNLLCWPVYLILMSPLQLSNDTDLSDCCIDIYSCVKDITVRFASIGINYKLVISDVSFKMR